MGDDVRQELPGHLRVPPDVAGSVAVRWPGTADDWPSRVERDLKRLCERYEAVPTSVMRARFAFVVAVKARTAGLVMRAGPDPDAIHQARVAEALGRLGVSPKVHEVMVTDTATWIVMDQITPGVPLGNLDGPPDARVLEDRLALMRGVPAPDTQMRSIGDWLRDRLLDDDLVDIPPGRDHAPATQRETALATLDDLIVDDHDQLCHGDMSPWNILTDDTHGVSLIDPRGMAGDLNYDVAVLALKAAIYAPPMTTAATFARRLGLSPDRAQAWIEVADAARV